MNKLFKLFEAIKHKPEMYLGNRSISSLYLCICGYSLALLIHGISEDGPTINDFQEWLYIKLEKPDSGKNWKTLILEEKENDEEKAFDYFFLLIKEYLDQKR
jgi:hypothetical protein